MYQPIGQVVPRLSGEVDWAHSFIRECYFVTDRHFCPFGEGKTARGIGDAFVPHDLRLVVAAIGEHGAYGIEFLLHGVSTYSLQAMEELGFYYSYHKSTGHTLDFKSYQSELECLFVADQIHVQFLDNEYHGLQLRLGHDIPNKNASQADILEGKWRQCKECCEAWEEKTAINYSRCPNCLRLTAIQFTL